MDESTNLNAHHLRSCHCCGLVQQVPILQRGEYAVCSRCETALPTVKTNTNQSAGMCALAALVFYPPALWLDMLQLTRLGHHHSDSLLSGIFALLTEGYWFIGGILLLFSVILPPLKLLILWLLTTQSILANNHRAVLYRAVEWVGRWGMLDVMLVAILVAFVKLGDLVQIQAGLGLFAFTIMVLLSLIASALFNPHGLWETCEEI